MGVALGEKIPLLQNKANLNLEEDDDKLSVVRKWYPFTG